MICCNFFHRYFIFVEDCECLVMLLLELRLNETSHDHPVDTA